MPHQAQAVRREVVLGGWLRTYLRPTLRTEEQQDFFIRPAKKIEQKKLGVGGGVRTT